MSEMAWPGAPAEWPGMHHERREVRTPEDVAFQDLTPWVAAAVGRSGIRDGIVNVQSRHTTAAIVVNEAEPLLLEDLRAALERFAPRRAAYRHDDFAVRTVNMEPGERKNGHAHCQSLLLRASESINVVDGALDLGRWQRVFLVELDGPRTRSVSLTIVGG